jgi:hypothetical protein
LRLCLSALSPEPITKGTEQAICDRPAWLPPGGFNPIPGDQFCERARHSAPSARDGVASVRPAGPEDGLSGRSRLCPLSCRPTGGASGVEPVRSLCRRPPARRDMRHGAPARNRTGQPSFGSSAADPQPGAIVRRDGFEPPCPWDLVYSEARSTRLCHRRWLGRMAGLEPSSYQAHNLALRPFGLTLSSQRRNRTLVTGL